MTKNEMNLYDLFREILHQHKVIGTMYRPLCTKFKDLRSLSNTLKASKMLAKEQADNYPFTNIANGYNNHLYTTKIKWHLSLLNGFHSILQMVLGYPDLTCDKIEPFLLHAIDKIKLELENSLMELESISASSLRLKLSDNIELRLENSSPEAEDIHGSQNEHVNEDLMDCFKQNQIFEEFYIKEESLEQIDFGLYNSNAFVLKLSVAGN